MKVAAVPETFPKIYIVRHLALGIEAFYSPNAP